MQSVLSGLTLEQCLDAYTREETLEEEDSWYCSSCQAHRRGVMKIDLWKMPDVLVSHVMSVYVMCQSASYVEVAREDRTVFAGVVHVYFGIMTWVTIPYHLV